MVNIWDKEIEINEKIVSALITEQFNIIIRSIRLIGQGFDNYAYLINGDLIFRFPRRKISDLLLSSEATILPYIGKLLDFPISYPRYFGKASDLFPHQFLGYPFMKGSSICDQILPPFDNEKFAKDFALALKKLHSIQIHENHLEGYNDTWRLDVDNRILRLKTYLDQYKDIFVKAGFDTNMILNLIKKLPELKLSTEAKSYVHGDLYSKHILIDEHNIFAGIIDWGDVHVGNPAIDISSAIMIFSESSYNIFTTNYGEFDDKIAVYRSFCHAIPVFAYSYTNNDANLQKWSFYALLRSIKLLQQLFI